MFTFDQVYVLPWSYRRGFKEYVKCATNVENFGFIVPFFFNSIFLCIARKKVV